MYNNILFIIHLFIDSHRHRANNNNIRSLLQVRVQVANRSHPASYIPTIFMIKPRRDRNCIIVTSRRARAHTHTRRRVLSHVIEHDSASYLLIVGRALGADAPEQRRLVSAPRLAGRHVLALRPLVPMIVRVMVVMVMMVVPEAAEATVPRVGRQLALARFPAPAARLDGRQLQRRGPQRGLVAAGQQQLQHLCVVHALHLFAIDVSDQVAGAETCFERRTARVHGLK